MDQVKEKPEDLLERTKRYARNVRDFFRAVPRTPANHEYERQGIRSSGSVAANYIESREAISKKDAVHRLRISRKETRETKLWVELAEISEGTDILDEQQRLLSESDQLVRIFTAIITKLTV